MYDTICNHTFLADIIGHKSRILDLGAHRGEFSELLSSKYGGIFYLVEANPLLANYLSRNHSFSVLHGAVCDKAGHIQFNISHNTEGSSVLSLPLESIWGCTHKETILVPSFTLNQVFTHFGLDGVDLIKMDIEGAEVSVLETISRSMLMKIPQLTIEFHSAKEFGFGLDQRVETLLKSLYKIGFSVLDFSHGDRTNVLLLNHRYISLPTNEKILWRLRSFSVPALKSIARRITSRYC